MNDQASKTALPQPRDLVIPDVVKTTVEVADPERFKLDLFRDLQPLLAEADAAASAIVDQASYDAAVAVGRRIVAKEKAVEEAIEKQFCAPSRLVWQNSNALKNAMVSPVSARKDALSKAVTAWRKKKDDEARIERERLAAEERERQRVRDEEQRKEDERRRKEEEDKRIEAALLAEQSGDAVRAAAILDTPVTLAPAPPPPPPMPAPAPILAAPAERVAGEVRKVKWTGSVVDRKAFFMALAEGKITWYDAIEFKQGWLNTNAKKFQDKMGQYIPGTVATSEDDTNFRS